MVGAPADSKHERPMARWTVRYGGGSPMRVFLPPVVVMALLPTALWCAVPWLPAAAIPIVGGSTIAIYGMAAWWAWSRNARARTLGARWGALGLFRSGWLQLRRGSGVRNVYLPRATASMHVAVDGDLPRGLMVRVAVEPVSIAIGAADRHRADLASAQRPDAWLDPADFDALLAWLRAMPMASPASRLRTGS